MRTSRERLARSRGRLPRAVCRTARRSPDGRTVGRIRSRLICREEGHEHLRRLERKVEGAVNGVFARAFKGDVQPVEIAARLQRELDAEAKLMSRDKRLVPNEFVVGLSEHDYDKLTPYSKTLIAELAGELKDHARDMGYVFNGPIRIHFERTRRLPTGRFTVASEAVAGIAERDRPGRRHDHQPGHSWSSRSTACATRSRRRASSSAGAPTPTCGSTTRASPGCTRRSRSAPRARDCRPRSSTWARPTASSSTAIRCAQATLAEGTRIEIGSTRMLVHAPAGR